MFDFKLSVFDRFKIRSYVHINFYIIFNSFWSGVKSGSVPKSGEYWVVGSVFNVSLLPSKSFHLKWRSVATIKKRKMTFSNILLWNIHCLLFIVLTYFPLWIDSIVKVFHWIQCWSCLEDLVLKICGSLLYFEFPRCRPLKQIFFLNFVTLKSY